MDQYTQYFDDDAPYETWDDVPSSQAQEATNPGHAANKSGYGYDAFLLDEPLNQFVDQQTQVSGREAALPTNPPSANLFNYEDLMEVDFTRQLYEGDSDLSALPSNSPAASIPSPPLAQQAEYQLPPPSSGFSPLVALPGSQRQSPRFNLPSVFRPETSSGQLPGRYLNNILNMFQDPSTALSVIDHYLFRFGSELQAALEQELQRQQNMNIFHSGYLAATNDIARCAREGSQFLSREFQDVIPAPPQHVPANNYVPAPNVAALHSVMDSTALPQLNPAATSAVEPYHPIAPMGLEDIAKDNTDGKKPKNKRPSNIKNFDPTKFYERLASHPEPWGSLDPGTNKPIFIYTAYGELDPLSTFTPAQISEYISQHPLNHPNGKSGLRLLIQTVPADSGRRYPNRASEKCRFAVCPDKHRTIRQGDFRVCFDEQSSQNSTTDPFHNAGYVHLFCLEKFLDFPQLCKDFNVSADVRLLAEGKNKMAITRDHPSMKDIVTSFIADSETWSQLRDGIRPVEYYEHTLNYMLTKEYLKKQSKHLQRVRAKRGGLTIDLHKNNLDLYVKMRKAYKKKSATEPTKKIKKGKRKQAESSDDKSSDESS